MSDYFIDQYVMEQCYDDRRRMRRMLIPRCRFSLQEACAAFERWQEFTRTPPKSYEYTDVDAAEEADADNAGVAAKVESAPPARFLEVPFGWRAFPDTGAGEQGAWPRANGRARPSQRKRLTAAEIARADAAIYASLKAHKHGEYSP